MNCSKTPHILHKVLLFTMIVVFSLPVETHAANNPLTGWAWSSNIGWVSFNSSDSNAGGGPYNAYVDDLGNFGGYAWSSNIGWLSFLGTDVTDCNNNTGTRAYVNTSTGEVTGWARFIAGKDRTDGWDGCVELSGTNHEKNISDGSRGVYYNKADGVFKGYAWGDDVVGWLSFNVILPLYTVSASPTILNPRQTVTATWTAPSGHSTTDWIGIYTPTALDSMNSYPPRKFVASSLTSGSLNFTAPATLGTYQFRYFKGNTYNRGAISNDFKVEDSAVTTGACGSAVGDYLPSETFLNSSALLCSGGNPSTPLPILGTGVGSTVSWSCRGSVTTADPCTATRTANPPASSEDTELMIAKTAGDLPSDCQSHNCSIYKSLRVKKGNTFVLKWIIKNPPGSQGSYQIVSSPPVSAWRIIERIALTGVPNEIEIGVFSDLPTSGVNPGKYTFTLQHSPELFRSNNIWKTANAMEWNPVDTVTLEVYSSTFREI